MAIIIISRSVRSSSSRLRKSTEADRQRRVVRKMVVSRRPLLLLACAAVGAILLLLLPLECDSFLLETTSSSPASVVRRPWRSRPPPGSRSSSVRTVPGAASASATKTKTAFPPPGAAATTALSVASAVIDHNSSHQRGGGGSGRASDGAATATATSDANTAAAASSTLYDVLGATGKETRSELKKLYVELAKRYHPDSARSGGGGHRGAEAYDDDDDGRSGLSSDFSEIAAAWRVLSNPKQRRRYDRTLRAERFSEDLAHFADDIIGKHAVPVLEKVAIPFLRRTTATTFAGIQALAEDLNGKRRKECSDSAVRSASVPSAAGTAFNGTIDSKQQASDLSTSFQAAMDAAQRANRYVDSIELKEKSAELEKLALVETFQLEQLDEQIQSLSKKRMTMHLHTPKSGMTSMEAFLLLQEFNQTVRDSVTMLDRAMLKHTVEEDILELQKAEIAWAEAEATNEEVQTMYDAHKRRKDEIHNKLRRAIQVEEDAMRALELAQKRVVQTKIALSEAIHDIEKCRVQAKKSTSAAKCASNNLARKSERVRKALHQKEKAVLKHKGLSTDETALADASPDEERVERMQQLKQLREEEAEVLKERSHVERKAAELLLKANELKQRADELECRP